MVQSIWNPITPHILFIGYSLTICFQLIVFVALYRLAKKNPTFLLLATSVSRYINAHYFISTNRTSYA